MKKIIYILSFILILFSIESKVLAICGLPLSTGLHSETVQVDSYERTFVVSVSSLYDSNTPTPIFIGYHGWGDTGYNYRAVFGISWEDSNGIFVYPDAYPSSSGAHWDLSLNGNDFNFFNSILNQLENEYCIDYSRIFVYGYSSGALFANILGCYNISVSAVAMIEGGFLGLPPLCLAPLNVWEQHNDQDSIVNIVYGRRSRDYWLTLNQCNGDFVLIQPSPCVEYQGCNQRLVWCENPNGSSTDIVGLDGHGWGYWTGDAMLRFFLSF